MQNLNSLFPLKSTDVSTSYPFGGAQDITVSGDGTGTPWIASLANDIFGLQQYLLNEAGITPSETADTALDSQQFTAMWQIFNMRNDIHNITVDADYTLTDAQNLKLRYDITDTNPFLSAARNIIIDVVPRRFLVANNTLQILTFKTPSGTGISVSAGSISDLYCDGTNVILAVAVQTNVVVGQEVFTDSTRTTLTASTSSTFWSFNYTKLFDSSTSYLEISGTISGHGSSASISGVRCDVDSLDVATDGAAYQGISYSGGTLVGSPIQMAISKQLSDVDDGSRTINIGWTTRDASSKSPFLVWNPNSTDGAAMQQQGSSLTVREILK